MIRDIEVCRNDQVSKLKTNLFSWIKIVNTNADNEEFNCAAFVYAFDDVTPAEIWSKGLTRTKAMTITQVHLIAKLILDWNYSKANYILLISCTGGISRSRAIALAIAEFLERDDLVEKIYHHPMSYPNPHVLKLMRDALGVKDKLPW